MAHRLMRGLRGAGKNLVLQRHSRPMSALVESLNSRNRLTGTPEVGYECGVILRFLGNDIQYELDRLPAYEPVPKFNSFVADGRLGEQWIRLSKDYGKNEHIKVEVTMFNRLPMKKTDDESEDTRLEVTLIVDVFKGKGNDILEFVCTATLDGIEIRKVYTRGHNRRKDQSYIGPEFKELHEDLQESLYNFLEARGIDDDLAEYLHLYIKHKDKIEYLRWMGNLKSFIQK